MFVPWSDDKSHETIIFIKSLDSSFIVFILKCLHNVIFKFTPRSSFENRTKPLLFRITVWENKSYICRVRWFHKKGSVRGNTPNHRKKKKNKTKKKKKKKKTTTNNPKPLYLLTFSHQTTYFIYFAPKLLCLFIISSGLLSKIFDSSVS